MDVASNLVVLGTLQRAATDIIQEASRAERGPNGRLFLSPDPGKRPILAPASQPEGLVTMSMLARPFLPVRFGFPDPLSCAAESVADWSLHRRLSVTKGAVWSPENAHSTPIIANSEIAAEDAAPGGPGDAQRGSIRQHRRALCRGSRRSQYQPPLGPSGS